MVFNNSAIPVSGPHLTFTFGIQPTNQPNPISSVSFIPLKCAWPFNLFPCLSGQVTLNMATGASLLCHSHSVHSSSIDASNSGQMKLKKKKKVSALCGKWFPVNVRCLCLVILVDTVSRCAGISMFSGLQWIQWRYLPGEQGQQSWFHILSQGPDLWLKQAMWWCPVGEVCPHFGDWILLFKTPFEKSQ